MEIDFNLKVSELEPLLKKFWQLSGDKIVLINDDYDHRLGSPVFTVKGKYTSRGWTEWTQGFEFGSSILQFDACGEEKYLFLGRNATTLHMPRHVSHMSVHDHGFNNISTFGNLLRLMKEGKISMNEWERNYYELALKLSGAVQANRWTQTADGGFIYSFNGPHSLFVDTIRSCRSLAVAYKLGHILYGENDTQINLLERMTGHILSTAKYSVFYGEGRDSFDVPGRTAHECLFNVNDGNYRCPSTQQGYSPFSTWTRGLAWALLGFTEELEFLETLDDNELNEFGGRDELAGIMLRAAKVTADFYIEQTSIDGIPIWDTGAPGLCEYKDYKKQVSNPENNIEPVDSSAAVIAAQGLLRLGNYLLNHKDKSQARTYWKAGLTVMKTLLSDPYLSTSADHQGLLLHSVYHWPNGWDYVPAGSKIPFGESSMWGDFHIREVALFLQRIVNEGPYYTFYNCILDDF